MFFRRVSVGEGYTAFIILQCVIFAIKLIKVSFKMYALWSLTRQVFPVWKRKHAGVWRRSSRGRYPRRRSTTWATVIRLMKCYILPSWPRSQGLGAAKHSATSYFNGRLCIYLQFSFYICFWSILLLLRQYNAINRWREGLCGIYSESSIYKMTLVTLSAKRKRKCSSALSLK